MNERQLPITNVIRVTVQGVQRSRGVKNINELALFTPEKPNGIDSYLIAYEPSVIENAYGTNSLTAQMARAIFSQNPNLMTGRGYLVVIPMQSAISATAPTITTVDLTNNVVNFKEVTDGSLNIQTNGVTYTATGLDFSQIANVNDIMTILQNAFIDVKISLVDGNKIQFEGSKLGQLSTVVIATGTGGTDITGENLLNLEGATDVAGVNSSGETLPEAIARTKNLVRYTGVIDALYQEDEAVTATADYISAYDIIYLNVWYSSTDIQGTCRTIQQKTQTQCRCLVYTMGYTEAKLMLSAYAGRAFSTNFSGSDTSQTMALKTLTGVTPDYGITQNDYTNAKTSGVDLYVSYEGEASVVSNGGNSYFDTIYENMALKFAMEAALFNVLRTTNTKIPQTEIGMSSLRNGVSQVMVQFVRNGVIAAGTWNSAQTFGDPEIFRENISAQGWYVYSLPITLQAQSEREQRIAPVIQAAVKRSGAIHEADLIVIVEE